MFYRRNILFFILFFIVTTCTPLQIHANVEKDPNISEESWLKNAGKGIGGYFFGLCTSAVLLTAFTNVQKNNPSTTYIATALATSFAGGCLTNFLIHRCPKKTLTALGVITLTLGGITTYAYCS